MTESDILWEHSYGKKLPEQTFCFFKDLNDALGELERLKIHVGNGKVSAHELHQLMGYNITQLPTPLSYTVGYSWEDIQEKAEVVAYNMESRFTDVKSIYMIKFPRARYLFTF